MKRAFTKILALTMVVALLAGSFAGCMTTKEPVETEDQTPPGLLTDDSTTPTESIPMDETEPTGTVPEEDAGVNIATVNEEQINVRAAPSAESTVIGQLVKGDQVEIVDEQTLMGVTWGKILAPYQGWIPMDLVNLPGGFVAPTEPEDPQESTAESTEPKETEPAEGTQGNGNTGIVAKGIVTASELNIRDAASTEGKKVGSYTTGDRVEILEKKNGWGRTNKGWISMDYIYQDGTVGKNTAKGIVMADQLNVRSGPGTNYDRTGSLSAGDRIHILEQFTINGSKWACIEKGWICIDQNFVYIDGTTGENSGTGTVTGDQLNIRSGPGTNYDRVGSLSTGDTVKVYTQIKIGEIIWGCIDGGWVSMEYVKMD